MWSKDSKVIQEGFEKARYNTTPSSANGSNKPVWMRTYSRESSSRLTKKNSPFKIGEKKLIKSLTPNTQKGLHTNVTCVSITLIPFHTFCTHWLKFSHKGHYSLLPARQHMTSQLFQRPNKVLRTLTFLVLFFSKRLFNCIVAKVCVERHTHQKNG